MLSYYQFKKFRLQNSSFILLMLMVSLSALTVVNAAERVQPFVLASQSDNAVDQVVTKTREQLTNAGFTVVGGYKPYQGAEVIVFTNDKMKTLSLKTERGGYGAILRASVTRVGNTTEVSYTTPVYWANAYRLKESLTGVASTLKMALGYVKPFGSGDKILSAADMREYHYTIMMEYFDDPSELEDFSSHAKAVQTVEKNLAAGKGAAQQIYKVSLGNDTKGKQMTLFGVGLKGKDADDCSGDKFIMSKIDKSIPRHTAHLPYEILVYGDEVEALYARFRIAVSWPHLPMMKSDTGATFMSIMCSPGDIEDALEDVVDD